jgi:hypothetical protein
MGTSVHIYILTHVHIHLQKINTYIKKNIHIPMSGYEHVFHICIRTYTYTYTYTWYEVMCSQAHIHTYTCI